MAATTSRKTRPALTPERIADLSTLAREIDAEEQDELKQVGRALMRHHNTVVALLARLKTERISRGLTLAEVGEHSGLGTANLSRLENDPSPNPTMDALLRYAEAVGVTMNVSVADA